jgi:hypothetical protein
MIGYTLPDGSWQAVWNHSSSQTQQLGRWMIRKIKAEHHGDIDEFWKKYIEDCPEGWSSLTKGKRCEDPVGFLYGQFDGIVASCDADKNQLCWDSNYLYLFYPPKRRLYVFEVKEGPMRPFGIVTFDEEGTAKPKKLPAIKEED